jgi:hypothetical protein
MIDSPAICKEWADGIRGNIIRVQAALNSAYF